LFLFTEAFTNVPYGPNSESTPNPGWRTAAGVRLWRGDEFE